MTVLQFEPSCSNREKEWFQEAMMRSNFPFDLVDLQLSVSSVAEPPCPGHNDYMCTETHYNGPYGDYSIIFLRSGTTDPDHPAHGSVPTVEGRKLFWLESAMHEIGHAFTLTKLARDAAGVEKVVEWFQYRDSPGSPRYGTPDDWAVGVSTTGEGWRNAISEAVAEWFKDLYLPAQYRWFSNRTAWEFRREFFVTWWETLEAFMCAPPVIDT